MKDGRLSGKLAGILRERIAGGAYAPGRLLPSLRQLAADHGVAYVTAVRAMKLLEREGIVAAETRRGYRALSLANDPLRGCPVAMIVGGDLADPMEWEPVHRTLLMALQAAAGRKGWSILGVTAHGRDPEDLVEQLKAARVVGAAVDSFNPDLIKALRRASVPAVLIDAWGDNLDVDGAVQDNYGGSFLAGRYLVERDCRQIAWAGLPVGDSAHSRERFGGAAAALHAAGQTLARRNIVEIKPGGELLPPLRALLRRKDRPDGVAALWQGTALAAKEVANELGLVVGRDLQLVGWATDETYDSLYAVHFSDPAAAAAIVWSATTMADTALRRLVERREHPDLPPLRLNVPTRLRTAAGREKSEVRSQRSAVSKT
jgi:DNA-binding LacI/PurR family transcriptional regulator